MMQKELWREFKYKYESPGFLRFLVNILGEKGVEASVTLWPNELFGELEEERNRFWKMNGEIFIKNIETYKEFLSKMKSRGIIPGWYLSFDNGFRQNNEPEIKRMNNYPHSSEFSTVHDEPYATLVHPANFIGRKWEAISLNSFEGEESIRRLKDAVATFADNGYALTFVHAGLNPQSWSHEYTGGTDYDGLLSASGGNLTISGHFPEDFDFKIFVPKSLPEGQRMLEQLVRTDKAV